MKKKKSLKLLLILTGIVLVLGYFSYHLIQWVFVPISTESALFTEEQEVIEAPGFIVRDEHLVTSDTKDLLFYPKEDGEHVGENGVIAEQYKSEADVSARKEIERLEEEIKWLEKFNNASERASVNPEQLQNKACEKVISLLTAVHDGRYRSVEEERESTQYVLNERLILYGDASSFSDRIKALEAQRDQLDRESSESTGQLRADTAGYFISYVDGYEAALSYADVREITPADLEEGRLTPEKTDDNVVGKLVHSYQWYIALTVSEREAYRIQEKKTGIALSIPSADGKDIPVELVTVNFSKERSEAAVIFLCDYMNQPLSRVREGKMQIILGTHKGLKIPKKALRMRECTAPVLQEKEKDTDVPVYEEEEGNYEGVYVRIRDTVTWRHIVSVFSGDDYIICAVSPKKFDPQNTSLLTYYDEVIVEGRNLEDGELIR